ncbi:uncharacterized protein DS421_14g467890 [Arachis hypogaea]|nr:uncharacterized protein DS421_14g467890 [Arachis hypogaea]
MPLAPTTIKRERPTFVRKNSIFRKRRNSSRKRMTTTAAPPTSSLVSLPIRPNSQAQVLTPFRPPNVIRKL